MVVKEILDFFNSIQIHYSKLNSINESDLKLIDEETLIKLSIEYGSAEKLFEFLILKYEKGVDVNQEYISNVFNEYNIDINQANILLNKLKQPKEPSFTKNALLKTPDFSKSKFEEISKTSFEESSLKNNKKDEIIKDNKQNPNLGSNKLNKEKGGIWSKFKENDISLPFYIINVLLLIYPKLSGTVWESGAYSSYEEVPVVFNISYAVLTFIISIASIYLLFINLKASKKLYPAVFFIGLLTIYTIYNPEDSTQVAEIEKECKEPDTSGRYMDKVYSRIRSTGCEISGSYFSGNGSYEIQAICPGGRIGVTNIEVLVNECGDILRVL